MTRRWLLVLLLIGTLAGCAFLQERKLDFEACKQDPGCWEQAQHWQATTETVSAVAASAVPVPGAAAAPKVLGYLALGVAALFGGHKLRKRTAAPTTTAVTTTTPT